MDHPMFSVAELSALRKRAQAVSFDMSDLYVVRALERLADAAGHVEALLNAYERIGRAVTA